MKEAAIFSKYLICFMMFWNLENLYDTKPSHLYNDAEFTHKGSKHWTFSKFKNKADNIAKIIISASIPQDSSNYLIPDIVAFAEVENRDVLEYLCNKTILAPFEYTVVHKDSPDPRGVDVALLYNSNRLSLENTEYYPVKLPSGDTLKTREILYAVFVGKQNIKKDTIHLFVNHWPSKRGGATKTEAKRLYVSDMLNRLIDSIKILKKSDIILACGDFNTDSPNIVINESETCNTNVNKSQLVQSQHNKLQFKKPVVNGTYKYKGEWEQIDYIFTYIPPSLRDNNYYNISTIYNHPYLLIPDKKYLGVKPKRTYSGLRYQRGISDHLPVLNKIFSMEDLK